MAKKKKKRKLSKDVTEMLATINVCKEMSTHYHRTVRQFSAFLGKPARRSHLRESVVNAWLIELAETYSGTTVHNYHRSLKRIWNYLASINEVEPYNLCKMRKTRDDKKRVEAWSIEQTRALLLATHDVPGTLRCGLQASALLRAYVLFAAETGLRPSDLRRLRADQIDPVTGNVNLTMHKTGFDISKQVSGVTLAALQPLLAIDSETLFVLDKSGLAYWSKRLFDIATRTHGFKRKRGQGLGTLRKFHATEVCRLRGMEAAAIALGHRSSAVTRKHYVEADAIAKPELPEEITLGLTG